MVGADDNLKLGSVSTGRRELVLSRQRNEHWTAFVISLHSYGLSLSILTLCYLMNAPWPKISVSFVLAIATASLNTCLTCLGQALIGASALDRAIGSAQERLGNRDYNRREICVLEDSTHEVSMLRLKYGTSAALTTFAWFFVAVIFAIEQGATTPSFKQNQFAYHLMMIALALGSTGMGLRKIYVRRHMRTKSEKLIEKLKTLGTSQQ